MGGSGCRCGGGVLWQSWHTILFTCMHVGSCIKISAGVPLTRLLRVQRERQNALQLLADEKKAHDWTRKSG